MIFLEVTDRRNALYKLVLNETYVIKVTDDGTGAVIVYRGIMGGSNTEGVEILKVVETYSDVKTALGL